MMHDTPVYDPNKAIKEDSLQDLRRILWARMIPDLIAPGQEDRLIIASGGQLRSLFSLVTVAGEFASGNRIEAADATRAIQEDRRLFRLRLGEHEGWEGEAPVPVAQKLAKLEAVYRLEPEAGIPDRTLSELIVSEHVQEFDGDGWFGLHPLTVEALKNLGRFDKNMPGGVPP